MVVLQTGCETTGSTSASTVTGAASQGLPKIDKKLQRSKVSVEDANDHWTRMRKGFKLSYDEGDTRIQHYITQYSKHNRHFLTLVERAKTLQFLITEAVETRELPLELALLPMVESALDPFADSHYKASGIWQIIQPTATLLGLQQDWWYDARRDHVYATQAALDYLEYLHQRFEGDWLLALAAYNSGEGTVSRAIYSNKKAGKPTHFHALKLPKETRDYVPKLLAIVSLIKSPQKYDVKLPRLDNEPYLKLVDIAAQVDLALAAELAEIDLKDLYKLNPGYNRWATHPDANGPHHLLLPILSARKLEKKIAYSDSVDWVNWETVIVKPGDTLSKIAKHHHTTVEVLEMVNNIGDSKIVAGKGLLVPMPVAPFARYAASKQKCTAKGCFRDQNIIHTVKNGESLWVIGKQYKVSVDNILGWNQIDKNKVLKPGQKLVIKAT